MPNLRKKTLHPEVIENLKQQKENINKRIDEIMMKKKELDKAFKLKKEALGNAKTADMNAQKSRGKSDRSIRCEIKENILYHHGIESASYYGGQKMGVCCQ